MYVVGARVTFPNELTKQSIKSYMTSELEGMNKMIMSFKIDTSSTQHLVINAFPSKNMRMRLTILSKIKCNKYMSWVLKLKDLKVKLWIFTYQ